MIYSSLLPYAFFCRAPADHYIFQTRLHTRICFSKENKTVYIFSCSYSLHIGRNWIFSVKKPVVRIILYMKAVWSWSNVVMVQSMKHICFFLYHQYVMTWLNYCSKRNCLSVGSGCPTPGKSLSIITCLLVLVFIIISALLNNRVLLQSRNFEGLW